MLKAFSAITALILGVSAAHAEPRKVALELVLAIDTSTSVDVNEYALQTQGLAAAFRDPQVLAAIRGLGPDGMAVAVVQWAGNRNAALAMPWTFVSDLTGADAVAATLESMVRRVNGRTDIATAITYSTNALNTNDFDGERRTIDVSGDGSSDLRDPGEARDLAVRQGITINGLVVYSDEYDLGDLASIALLDHYTQRVIGGPGAFVVEALDFTDFAAAMRRKLVREIAGPNFAALPTPPPTLTPQPVVLRAPSR